MATPIWELSPDRSDSEDSWPEGKRIYLSCRVLLRKLDDLAIVGNFRRVVVVEPEILHFLKGHVTARKRKQRVAICRNARPRGIGESVVLVCVMLAGEAVELCQ